MRGRSLARYRVHTSVGRRLSPDGGRLGQGGQWNRLGLHERNTVSMLLALDRHMVVTYEILQADM
jgi:hypothetical protein